jgi:hypothetical protein
MIFRVRLTGDDDVTLVLKTEFSASVANNDHAMRRRFAHTSSEKRGDVAISSNSNFSSYDPISRQTRFETIPDIKSNNQDGLLSHLAGYLDSGQTMEQGKN